MSTRNRESIVAEIVQAFKDDPTYGSLDAVKIYKEEGYGVVTILEVYREALQKFNDGDA